MDKWRVLAEQLAARQSPDGWAFVSRSRGAWNARNASAKIYYKEFCSRDRWFKGDDAVKRFFTGGRARRTQVNLRRLRAAGFNAPECIACGMLKDGREYLFTHEVAGQSAAAVLGAAKDLRARRRFLHALGDAVGRLHAAGFAHGDLLLGNILVTTQADGFQFAFINNERSVRVRCFRLRRIGNNLLALNLKTNASRADRMRFFIAWQKHMRLSKPAAKKIARKSYQAAQRRRARKRK